MISDSQRRNEKDSSTSSMISSKYNSRAFQRQPNYHDHRRVRPRPWIDSRKLRLKRSVGRLTILLTNAALLLSTKDVESQQIQETRSSSSSSFLPPMSNVFTETNQHGIIKVDVRVEVFSDANEKDLHRRQPSPTLSCPSSKEKSDALLDLQKKNLQYGSSLATWTLQVHAVEDDVIVDPLATEAARQHHEKTTKQNVSIRRTFTKTIDMAWSTVEEALPEFYLDDENDHTDVFKGNNSSSRGSKSADSNPISVVRTVGKASTVFVVPLERHKDVQKGSGTYFPSIQYGPNDNSNSISNNEHFASDYATRLYIVSLWKTMSRHPHTDSTSDGLYHDSTGASTRTKSDDDNDGDEASGHSENHDRHQQHFLSNKIFVTQKLATLPRTANSRQRVSPLYRVSLNTTDHYLSPQAFSSTHDEDDFDRKKQPCRCRNMPATDAFTSRYSISPISRSAVSTVIGHTSKGMFSILLWLLAWFLIELARRVVQKEQQALERRNSAFSEVHGQDAASSPTDASASASMREDEGTLEEGTLRIASQGQREDEPAEEQNQGEDKYDDLSVNTGQETNGDDCDHVEHESRDRRLQQQRRSETVEGGDSDDEEDNESRADDENVSDDDIDDQSSLEASDEIERSVRSSMDGNISANTRGSIGILSSTRDYSTNNGSRFEVDGNALAIEDSDEEYVDDGPEQKDVSGSFVVNGTTGPLSGVVDHQDDGSILSASPPNATFREEAFVATTKTIHGETKEARTDGGLVEGRAANSTESSSFKEHSVDSPQISHSIEQNGEQRREQLDIARDDQDLLSSPISQNHIESKGQSEMVIQEPDETASFCNHESGQLRGEEDENIPDPSHPNFMGGIDEFESWPSIDADGDDEKDLEDGLTRSCRGSFHFDDCDDVVVRDGNFTKTEKADKSLCEEGINHMICTNVHAHKQSDNDQQATRTASSESNSMPDLKSNITENAVGVEMSKEDQDTSSKHCQSTFHQEENQGGQDSADDVFGSSSMPAETDPGSARSCEIQHAATSIAAAPAASLGGARSQRPNILFTDGKDNCTTPDNKSIGGGTHCSTLPPDSDYDSKADVAQHNMTLEKLNEDKNLEMQHSSSLKGQSILLDDSKRHKRQTRSIGNLSAIKSGKLMKTKQMKTAQDKVSTSKAHRRSRKRSLGEISNQPMPSHRDHDADVEMIAVTFKGKYLSKPRPFQNSNHVEGIVLSKHMRRATEEWRSNKGDCAFPDEQMSNNDLRASRKSPVPSVYIRKSNMAK